MGKDVSIKICMGTGGIAAGGEAVIASFEKALASAGIRAAVEKNCSVHQVGCRGFCARDVLVDVLVDGAKATYEYIKPDMVEKIVSEHIVGGVPVAQWLVKDGYDDFHNKQQKVLLARLLESKPRVLLLDEPTRGIDVGAKSQIYQIIDALAQQGAAILVISSEGIAPRSRASAASEADMSFQITMLLPSRSTRAGAGSAH